MLKTEKQGGVLTVTLNRPEVGNALNNEIAVALADALGKVAEDPSVRVVVLAGAGKHFCAGADITYMQQSRHASREENLADARSTQRLFASIADLPRPVVARVHGAARGGGAGLLAAADIVVAADGVTFAFTEVRLGIVPAMISPFVIERLGPARARHLFLTGESFGTADALRWGLVDRVVPAAEIDAAVAAVVADLLKGGPQALAETKALVREVLATPRAEIGARTSERIARLRASEEGQEGLTAFLEKRPPRWVP
jgi:methylglutaconyl-CoA hydratase